MGTRITLIEFESDDAGAVGEFLGAMDRRLDREHGALGPAGRGGCGNLGPLPENRVAPPVQVNVFPSGTAHDQVDKGDIRHAELRSDIHAVKASVDGVGQVVAEVKRENEDLKVMQAAGFLRFMSVVEAADMRMLMAILQHGDQSKAAKALGMKDATFREKTKAWVSKSREYRRMHRLISWRKSVGRKEMLPLSDELIEKIRVGVDREDILRQVLEGLAEMNGRNWPHVRDELKAAIMEV